MYKAGILANNRNWIIYNVAGCKSRHLSASCAHDRSNARRVACEPFMNGTSSKYVEEMYSSWLNDPNSVHKSWDTFFGNIRSGCEPGTAYRSPPSLVDFGPKRVTLSGIVRCISSNEPDYSGSLKDGNIGQYLAVHEIISLFQTRGHLLAKLDPLQLSNVDTGSKRIFEVLCNNRFCKFNDTDMTRVFELPPTTFIGGTDRFLPLHEILQRLENVYCRHIGSEFMFIDSLERCNWIRQRLETPKAMEMSADMKRLILNRLMRASGFETFMARKWPSEKRYGLEGCEIMIPALKQIIDKSTELGVESVVIGMPHRGRLNMLANVFRKPLEQIFTQFAALEQAQGAEAGDKIYHKGTNVDRLNRISNKSVRLAIVANPSHLEVVNPVVQGKVRAEQFYRGDVNGKKVMPILLHGDSAFCGQGVVYETFHLSDLREYTTHGTIHIVVNNQIGFTTDPLHSRSSMYSTDVAKIINAPVFYVNSDDPEAVIHVCNIASEWRNTFHKDVVVDIIGYRKNGHNEVDEPMFTQPLMYSVIEKTEPILQKYSNKLVEEGIVTEDKVKDTQEKYDQICEYAYVSAINKNHTINFKEWLDSPWSEFFQETEHSYQKMSPTGVKDEILVHIGKLFSSPPPEDGFVIHKGVERILKARLQMINNRQIDWVLAEAMAFGSLLKEGIHVRLSGQDVERGTFSHRHHVLHHQLLKDVTYRPLSRLYPNQAPYTVCNSSLSEFAVMGFEFGYSMTNPNALVCWEAQFGDFSNTAQGIIDQFVSSGQSKWAKQCGLVLLLPHGLEGVGSEHSSARLERFLQMSSEDVEYCPDENEDIRSLYNINWIIANCTTPANYFHILRRQIALPFRKPLVLMTPKSLLRHPDARSTFDEINENTEFLRIIPEAGAAVEYSSNVRKIIFCTGKVYYDLKKARNFKSLDSEIAISRIEQITPFPFDLVRRECEKYPDAQIVWVQEEHKNQGAWAHVQPRLQAAINSRHISYVGREPSAAPATGSKSQHLIELANLLEKAML